MKIWEILSFIYIYRDFTSSGWCNALNSQIKNHTYVSDLILRV